jgi:hypothetical protein
MMLPSACPRDLMVMPAITETKSFESTVNILKKTQSIINVQIYARLHPHLVVADMADLVPCPGVAAAKPSSSPAVTSSLTALGSCFESGCKLSISSAATTFKWQTKDLFFRHFFFKSIVKLQRSITTKDKCCSYLWKQVWLDREEDDVAS